MAIERLKRAFAALRAHWPALAVAVFATLVVVAPLAAFPGYAGNRYAGINIAHFGDDEHYYLSRAHEVLEGRGLGQPFLAEGKDAQDPTVSYAERIVLAPAMLFGAHPDVVSYVNVANALGVFALALILYAFSFVLSGKRWLAAGTAAFVLCGYSLIYNKELLFSDFNVYGRSFFPYVSSILFFIWLALLYGATVARRGIRYVIAAGAFFGALFYVYFYAWTFALALSGSLIAVLLFRRDWPGLRAVALTTGIGALIGLPALFMLARFYLSSASAQVSFFLFSLHSHAPVMSLVGLATAALFAVHSWLHRDDPNAPFILALILAGWVALNEQVLTGRVVQYGHYYWYFIVPLSIIVGAYLLYRLLPQRLGFLLPVALVVLSAASAVCGQYLSFYTTLADKLHEQEYASALAALRSLPEGVVLTSATGEFEPFLVTIYTRDDLYWLPAAELYAVPAERIREALLVNLYMDSRSHSDPIGYLVKHANDDGDPYVNMFDDLMGYESGLDYYAYRARLAAVSQDPVLAAARANLLGELDTLYRQEFSSPAAVRAFLRERNVRYVLLDASLTSSWDLSVLRPVLVEERGGVSLYKVNL